MMLAVMYGMIPSANTAKRVSAPPANRLRKFRMFVVPWFSRAAARRSGSTPGTGTYEPKRNTSSIAAVNHSFFRSSGDRSELSMAWSISGA